MSDVTTNGVVKRLKPGFGFLRLDNGVEVFFLPTHLKQSPVRFDELREGQTRVYCEFEEAERGPRATKVVAEA